MPKAVRFAAYGGIDVLQVVEVPRPTPGPGEVLIRVKAAGMNPGESKIRQGLLRERFPATFPSGQGSDLAGVVDELGPDVRGIAVGDEMIGFTNNRASQAEFVTVDAAHLTPRPPGVSWEVAGALFVVGATAWAATRAVKPRPGDVVVVSAAAGGVGSIAVQLLALDGATVVGIASERNHPWLQLHGAIPVTRGDGVADRIRAAADGHVDAMVDTFGSGYVDLALELGVAPERIDTIVDATRAAEVGAHTDGSMVGARAAVLAELAALIDKGKIEVPIAAVYPLDQVRDAYRELERPHAPGKIVLVP
jgi:NADPH:quinone reductase-like Zn-dependent oxidoreductase